MHTDTCIYILCTMYIVPQNLGHLSGNFLSQSALDILPLITDISLSNTQITCYKKKAHDL